MITQIKLENFTVFKHLEMDASKGINVFIGANGTGKTHLMKLLYTVLAALNEGKRISDKIIGVFLPKDKRIGRLARRTTKSTRARVIVARKDKKLSLNFSNHTKDTLKWNNGWKGQKIGRAVYIPVKEMLANAPNFLSLYDKFDLHFEEVYADIIHYASAPVPRGPIEGRRKKLLQIIQKTIEGVIVQKNEEFFLRNKQGELEFTLLAEGMRKLGLLWLLIQNGTLLNGTTLFWDEPEANLNPKLIRYVVDILLELQRIGVQIFIATHDYVLLKEFDLRKKDEDSLLFHSLYRDEKTNEINIHSTDNYLQIHPNMIQDTFLDLFDRDVKRDLES